MVSQYDFGQIIWNDTIENNGFMEMSKHLVQTLWKCFLIAYNGIHQYGSSMYCFALPATYYENRSIINNLYNYQCLETTDQKVNFFFFY